jgi:hypothetical protein
VARKKSNTWVDDILHAFGTLGGEANWDELYAEIDNNGRTVKTPQQKATVRKEVERKSSDSANYDGTEDLFQRVGPGRWKVR